MKSGATPPIRSQTGRVVLAGLGAGLFAYFGGQPYWSEHLLAACATHAACLSFGAAGALLSGSGDNHRLTGRLLLLGAVCYPVGWLVSWNAGVAPVISFYGQALFYLLAGCAVLTYPAGHFTGRGEKGWVIAAAIVLFGGQLAVQLLSRPEWNGLRSDVVWPNLALTKAVFERVVVVVIAGQLVVVAWYLVLLWFRGRRLSGLDRMVVLPVLATAGLVGCVLAVFTSQDSAWTDLDALLSFYFLQGTITLLVPLAVLSGALRDRWRELSAPHRVVAMTSSTTSVATVRTALAEALRDRTLVLLFWVPSEHSYSDETGRLVSHPADRPVSPGRWWVETRTDDKQPLAMVELDEALRLRPAMVEAVLRAGSQALLTAQLQAAANAHLKQMLAAQARLEESGLAERRRLEQDLFDGAQRQLAALVGTLGLLATAASADAVRAVAVECRDEALATIADLRSLTGGLHPTVLRTDGLGPALDAVAERLGLMVELTVCVTRQPPAVEATAYFALCEALTNVAKYAPEATVRIKVTEVDGWLHGEVTDDGPGGARLVPGGGLAGITARTRALHGWAALESTAGSGTRLRVSLPCG